MKLKKILPSVGIVIAFLLLFLFFNRLLSPKYATDLVEGSMIGEYYREAGGHDVIFIGDCEVYANFSPMDLYREYGITAYVRGTPQQLLWQSYYVLQETLTYETPQAVVFNVNAMRYAEPVSEAYNRLTIDRMRWSPAKAGIIRASMLPEETFLSYVFPILRYHSRFSELTQEDMAYLFRNADITFNGHLLNQRVKPAEGLPAKRPLADYSFADICYDYLGKMEALCREKGVELILIKAPSLYPYWYDEYDAQIREYAGSHGLSYYNFTAAAEEIGLDYAKDTYDAGLHLNHAGAVKLSRYFGQILAREHGLDDHRNDPAVSALYNEKLAEYDAAVAAGQGS